MPSTLNGACLDYAMVVVVCLWSFLTVTMEKENKKAIYKGNLLLSVWQGMIDQLLISHSSSGKHFQSISVVITIITKRWIHFSLSLSLSCILYCYHYYHYYSLCVLPLNGRKGGHVYVCVRVTSPIYYTYITRSGHLQLRCAWWLWASCWPLSVCSKLWWQKRNFVP